MWRMVIPTLIVTPMFLIVWLAFHYMPWGFGIQ